MPEDDGSDLVAAVMAAMADPVVVLAGDLRLVWANEAAERRFGWSLDELRDTALDRLVHPDDRQTAASALRSLANQEVGSLVEIRVQDATDQYSWFEIRGRAWPEGPREGCIILNLRPTTERRRWELAAGDSHMLAVLLDAAPVVLLALRANGTISGANRALGRMLARDIESLLGTPLADLVDPDDRAVVAEALTAVAGTNGTRQFEARLVASGDTRIPMSFTVVDLLADRAVKGLVLAASDITSLVQARTALHHLANHDELTGLPNRTNLRDRLQRLLDGTPRPACTLLFGDVDGLKPINDTHGHQAGDAALSEIANRLRRVTRDQDYVARLSGDEFVMLISTTDPGVIADVQDRIDAAMREPITLPDGTDVAMTISLGVSPAADGALSAEQLLAAADAAMYEAKRARPLDA